MATNSTSEIVLYDLACVKGVCFSPVAWRIRLMLNYKQIPYDTVFVEFPDIKATAEGFGLKPNASASEDTSKYTVPIIHHKPTNQYVMDSPLIAQFLESTYPDHPVPIDSSVGNEIQKQARAALAPVVRIATMPREADILSPRAGDYFRSTREASLGHPLKDLLSQEEQTWEAGSDKIRAVGEMLLQNKSEGPFISGAKPSYVDFALAGALQSVRVVHEATFDRIVEFPGFGELYESCAPYMQRQD